MSEIRNCALGFSCTKQWDELQPLTEPNIRYCRECGDKVYFCETDDEIIANIRANNCIAYQTTFSIPVSTLGMPVFFPPLEFALNDKNVIAKLVNVKIDNFGKIVQFSRNDIKLLAGLTELDMREIDEFMIARGICYQSDDH